MGIKHQRKTKLPKYVDKSVEGKCKYCHKHVQNLEAHIKTKHMAKRTEWKKTKVHRFDK